MKVFRKLKALAVAVFVFLLTPVKVFADEFQGFEEVTQDLLDQSNPLNIGNSSKQAQLSTPGGIITEILTYAFPIAGLILFVMITWGGFEMLSDAATKKSIDAGRNRVKAAIIGFIILFASFWLVRILEFMFDVNIVTF